MMEMTRKHLLSLAILTAFSPVLVTQAHAQLHLEIAKAPEEAPKIAIVPFSNDSLYPIIETDLNRSGNLPALQKIYLQQPA
jgi:TolB protein